MLEDAREDQLLAVIENRVINKEDFIAVYKQLKAKTDLPDNGQSRKEIFNTILEEELLIAEAEARGYDKDSHGSLQSERIQIQELLDAFHRKFILNAIVVSEDELRTLFVRFNTKIKARHLYAHNFKQADSLYTELHGGRTFEELAEKGFQDPQLRNAHGSVGWFSVDEMDPFFEDVAFTLGLGQISKPIRTAQGYSIIQVQDRITKPLLTEAEYAKHHSNLERYWRDRKAKKATRAFVDSLRQQLEISFHRDVVKELLEHINSRSHVAAAVEANNHLLNDERFAHKELVRSKLGVWNVRTLNQNARFTSEGQLHWVRNEENLEDFIAGLIIRAFMLSKAKELGLHKSVSYHTNIKRKQDEYLLERMQEIISEATIIPEDTLRQFFQHHKDKFLLPPQIQLREIVLNNAHDALVIKNRIASNASFEELAKTYSTRRWSAEKNGDAGSFSYQELGAYSDRIFPLEVGQWVGPIKIDAQYAFFKCVGKDSARARTFNEARTEIEKTLKPFWQRKTRQALLASIRRRAKVVAYPERLNSIQLN
ncbi:peptidylprolyl isomerase [candidate division KSB1 bacterium]|nr:peptidylprolyl isomerase [candidate division KSB1 bacterium]